MSNAVISLFSGAMGMDIGLELAGGEVVGVSEMDPDCLGTIRSNRPGVDVLGPVEGVDGSELSRRHGELFAVIGGPPCQAYSSIGKGRGFDDPRGLMLFEFGRVVKESRPRFFVLENVLGLLSAKGYGGDPGGALRELESSFLGIGYRLERGVVDAADYGVPQRRERVLLFGSRDGEEVFVPLPTRFWRHQEPSLRWMTLGEAIRGMEDAPGPFLGFSSRMSEAMDLVPAGGNWRSMPEDRQREFMGKAMDSSGGRTSFYRRLSYDEPSTTLVTSPRQRATTLCHPTRTRPLSVREYAAIQGFPPSWRFSGSLASQYRQIGNAVPVEVGRAIMGSLLATAAGEAGTPSRRSTQGPGRGYGP